MQKKKKKNVIMVSFQAKMVLDRLRMIQKKSYRFDQFLPDLECRIPKIFAKKNSIN